MSLKSKFVLKTQFEVATFHCRENNRLLGVLDPPDGYLFRPSISYWRSGTTKEQIDRWLQTQCLRVYGEK